MGPQIKAGHMGAPLPYGVRLKKEPLTAGSFHIWESLTIQFDPTPNPL